MNQPTPINATLTPTEAKSQVMRSILAPLQPIMEEATPDQTWTEDEIFFNIALPLLTHLRPSITEIIAMPPLWSEWRRMGDYAVLMVRFGIRDSSVTGMRLGRSTRMEHW